MPDKKNRSRRDAYLRYSGMAFELIALLVIAAFLGKKLDQWMELDKPYFTLSLLVFFLIAYFVRIYYTLIK